MLLAYVKEILKRDVRDKKNKGFINNFKKPLSHAPNTATFKTKIIIIHFTELENVELSTAVLFL